ncbi:hypothetical protein N7463_010493 [Penicillium fimorum]|uniref:Uncharacterized protein n=1 Tax=Penicillium fimorum TaxID=1882269 RepID=A0A9W9XK16_9EURO|nr:hypothetical protein N7463_010493 [Penicillium fimorum]
MLCREFIGPIRPRSWFHSCGSRYFGAIATKAELPYPTNKSTVLDRNDTPPWFNGDTERKLSPKNSLGTEIGNVSDPATGYRLTRLLSSEVRKLEENE